MQPLGTISIPVRARDLHILVATKTFGMGMDIRGIHWVVDLSSPAYLEDYLQEVGGIGRCVVEKRQAALEQIEAILPASSSDFESMRRLRAMNELCSSQIHETEGKINGASEIIEGRRLPSFQVNLMRKNERLGWIGPRHWSGKREMRATFRGQ